MILSLASPRFSMVGFSAPFRLFVLVLFAVWGLSAAPVHAQRAPVEIDWRATAQQYDLETDGPAGFDISDPDPLRQVATSLSVRAPIGERWRFGLRAQAAQTGDLGTDLPGIEGLDDLGLSGYYTQPLGDVDLVLGVDASIPIGKETLSSEQLATAVALSRDVYAFSMPSYGQGVRVVPSLSLTIPVAEGVMLGISGSARFYGTYTPVNNMPDPYAPGASTTTTVGLDVLLTPTSALSGDVEYAMYDTDTVGGVDQLELGNRWSATVRYINRFSFNEFRATVQFEERSKSTVFEPIAATGSVVSSDLRLRPRESFASSSLRLRLAQRFYTTLTARGSWFRETTRFDSALVGRFRLRPEVLLSDRWTLTSHVQADVGDVSGIGGGLGLSVDL